MKVYRSMRAPGSFVCLFVCFNDDDEPTKSEPQEGEHGGDLSKILMRLPVGFHFFVIVT